MKKVLALLAVAALTCVGGMAFAADVTTDGSIDIRSRAFDNLDASKTLRDNNRDTQERIRLGINAKAGEEVKARIQIENDLDTWGRVETYQGNSSVNSPTVELSNGLVSAKSYTVDNAHLMLREAWVEFKVPGLPVTIKGGHQLLQLGNGWFFRAMKYGSDAWVATTTVGDLSFALVDVKAMEWAKDGDTDTYTFIAKMKLNDKTNVGLDLTQGRVSDGANYGKLGAGTILNNIGLNYTGVVGPVNLKAELDLQSGSLNSVPTGTAAKTARQAKGQQVVIQGNMPVAGLTVNFTVAQGSGQSATAAANEQKQFVNLLDGDPHYTFLYEYKMNTAASSVVTGSKKSTGFANTRAINLGASTKVGSSLDLALDVWLLTAVEKVSINGGTASDKLGTEVDAKINWKLYDNLTWNWTLGYFKTGDAYAYAAATKNSNDAATGVQGVLTMKF